MPGITISSGYGAGGSVVAPAVAQSLGVSLLDRAISSRVAHDLHVSEDEARTAEVKRSFAERFFGVLAPMAGGVTGIDTEGLSDAPLPMNDAEEFRRRAEQIIRTALVEGVVVLGRAGAAMLHAEPTVLKVRLFGAFDARVAQGARLEGIDRDAAAHRLPEVDAARALYVKRLYHVDIDDPDLYDLQLDSTVVPLDGCAEVIVTAFRALTAVSRPESG